MRFFLLACLLCVASANLQILKVKEPVKDQYIVLFKQKISKELRDSHIDAIRVNSTILYEYDAHKLQGYAAEMGEIGLQIAQRSPHVEVIEQNGMVYASDHPKHPNACTTQTGTTWGLVRTAQEDLSLTGDYKYESSIGAGVDAYIIDTGIYLTHTQFGGRATWGTNTVDNSDSDGNGHGTHVAGTVGASIYGLSKACNLIAVKVLNAGGSGTTAGVIAGVNWVINNALEKYGKEKKQTKGVGNMSLGGGRSTTLNAAVDNAHDAEIIMAVAAGNDYNDACNYSPASAEKAIGTGASDNTDSMAYFSNFGSCVDVFGPGLSITSTWNGGPNSDNTISGTSMAAPHVAGVAVKLIWENPTWDADRIKAFLLESASENKLSGVRGSPNKLTYHGCYD